VAVSPFSNFVRAYGNAPVGPNTCWVGNFRVGNFSMGTHLTFLCGVKELASLGVTDNCTFLKNGQNHQKRAKISNGPSFHPWALTREFVVTLGCSGHPPIIILK
jgi:hypothetical protein